MNNTLIEYTDDKGNIEYLYIDQEDLAYSLAKNKKLTKIIKKIFNEYVDLVDTDTIYDVTLVMLKAILKMYREYDGLNTKLDQQILKTAIQSLNSLRINL